MQYLFLSLVCMFTFTDAFSQQRDTIHLWPGQVPGAKKGKHPAVVAADTSRQVTRLTDVTDPILIVFEPETASRSDAGVIVCPGGGYQILAIDLEGYEVAKWLNSLGYTAFVLQYRVPGKRQGALQDLQRAIRIVKSRAGRWRLAPDKVGVIGFSAGGSLAARASTLYNRSTYPAIDEADTLSARPAFSLLVYPAYLDQGPQGSLTPELHVNGRTPPMFLFATADDHYSNSALVMAGALRNAKVPVELHLYNKGGHGYGLRPGNPAAEAWPALAEKWMARIMENGFDE